MPDAGTGPLSAPKPVLAVPPPLAQPVVDAGGSAPSTAKAEPSGLGDGGVPPAGPVTEDEKDEVADDTAQAKDDDEEEKEAAEAEKLEDKSQEKEDADEVRALEREDRQEDADDAKRAKEEASDDD